MAALSFFYWCDFSLRSRAFNVAIPLTLANGAKILANFFSTFEADNVCMV